MDEQTTKRELTAEEWEARLERIDEMMYQRVMKKVQKTSSGMERGRGSGVSGYYGIGDEVFQNTDPELSQNIITNVREQNKNGACVDQHDAGFFSGARNFVVADRMANITVAANGDIVRAGKISGSKKGLCRMG